MKTVKRKKIEKIKSYKICIIILRVRGIRRENSGYTDARRGENAREIFAWTGNEAALPLPRRLTRGSSRRASERSPGHIYGTTGFVSRPPDEDVVRTVTHISRVTACRAPYSRVIYIYIYAHIIYPRHQVVSVCVRVCV